MAREGRPASYPDGLVAAVRALCRSGLNQKWVARRAKVSVATLKRWMRTRHPVRAAAGADTQAVAQLETFVADMLTAARGGR